MFADEEFETLRTQNPLAIFGEWFAAAQNSEAVNPESLSLATLAADGTPQVRTVLLKSFDERGFVFYTNRDSRKGEALRAHPRAAMLFYWKSLGRQVNIEGAVREFSHEETQPYFNRRPLDSRIGAIASLQSRPLTSLKDFRTAIAQLQEKYDDNNPPPCPDAWRGFVLNPQRMEFWCEGQHRHHQRMAFYKNDSDNNSESQWQHGQLLYP